MDFFTIYWPAFLAALSANLITAAIIYAGVMRYRGHSTGFALTRAGQMILTVSFTAIRLYIGLLVLGAFAYAIKLTIFG